MKQNTLVRKAVAQQLENELPVELGVTVFDTWQIIDADKETPAVMVYQDNGERNTTYLDLGEQYDGVLMVSIYCSGKVSDDALDEIGEAVKTALPIGWRSVGLCTIDRTAFQYERAEGGAYRALHLTHPYESE